MSSRDKTESPYEILGLEVGASDADIKRAFRQKSATTHPDRKGTGSRAAFEKVKQARDLLLNEEMGSKLDVPAVITETISVNEMELNESSNHYEWDCRCGGMFEIEKNSIREDTDGVIIPCDGCSLAVRVVHRKVK